jgi:hypothetical protein
MAETVSQSPKSGALMQEGQIREEKHAHHGLEIGISAKFKGKSPIEGG